MPYILPSDNSWTLQLPSPRVLHRPALVDKLQECVELLATSPSPLQVKLSICLVTLHQGQPGSEVLHAFNEDDRALVQRRCTDLLEGLTEAFRYAHGSAEIVSAMPDDHAEQFAQEFFYIHDVLLQEYPAYAPRRSLPA